MPYIHTTEKWIEKTVIGQNFCPFAAREVRRKALRYVVVEENDITRWLDTLLEECQFLDENEAISTTILIFPNVVSIFSALRPVSVVPCVQQILTRIRPAIGSISRAIRAAFITAPSQRVLSRKARPFAFGSGWT